MLNRHKQHYMLSKEQGLMNRFTANQSNAFAATIRSDNDGWGGYARLFVPRQTYIS